MKSVLRLAGLTLVALMAWSCQPSGMEEYGFGTIRFNAGWEFVRDIDWPINKIMDPGAELPVWESVNLPHTAYIEPLVIKGKQWQGHCIYRKIFEVPKKMRGRHIALYFEGAMQVAEVYLNSELIYTNSGGYLPFYVDMSGRLKFGHENTLVVRLNNEDNPLVPPGKPLADLDFNIYSGLYRNVWMVVKEAVHISNAVEVDHIAGGGIWVNYSAVSTASALVHANVEIKNDSPRPKKVTIQMALTDAEQLVGTHCSEPVMIGAKSTAVLKSAIKVSQPKLWSPDRPHLYDLVVTLEGNDGVLDRETLNIGIRTVDIEAGKGFMINGEQLKLRGTNRHQEYPYVGYALSDNASYRDAWKIKQAGFNMVRLSHYPQSRSFLDACDELGILVMDAIPGWQFFGGETFQENALSDVRRMARVDRNHPSVVLWEASLNESQMDSSFMLLAHQTLHEELPGEGVYTCGWIDYAYDVFIPARQHARAPYYWNTYDKSKPLLIAEYGDWEYYAQNAGFNQKEFRNLSDKERSSRQLRAYGQKRLAQQALNYQEAHNSNLKGPALGDANWLMFDYNRGYAPDIESSGIMDIFRLPKFSYYFFRSQCDFNPSSKTGFMGPVVYISNFYNDPSFMEIKVYSNCDEVELLVNGQSISRQVPDSDQNSSHLKHPPFTFRLPAFVPGQLEARAYVDGRQVAQDIRNTPEVASSVKVWIDESGRALQKGCKDLVFAYAAVVDKQGTILPQADNMIRFELDGDAELIGVNPIKAEAGIACILVQAGNKGGPVKLTTSSAGLKSGELSIHVE